MSYSTCYLIHIRGTDFNGLMQPSHQIAQSQIDELVGKQEANMWDGMLIDSDIEFLVDLTGDWTLCKLPYAYSILLDDSQGNARLGKIKIWEHQIRQLVPDCEIVRMDDFYFDQWNSRYDYLLIRNPQGILAFLEWLQSQDHRHWAKLSE